MDSVTSGPSMVFRSYPIHEANITPPTKQKRDRSRKRKRSSEKDKFCLASHFSGTIGKPFQQHKKSKSSTNSNSKSTDDTLLEKQPKEDNKQQGDDGSEDSECTITKLMNKPLEYEEEFLSSLPVSLFNYQVQALRWMYHIENDGEKPKNYQVGGILADVMGLGKTIDSIALILYDVFMCKKRGLDPKKVLKPTLIVASLTLMTNWLSECTEKFLIPQTDIIQYHRTNRYQRLTNYLNNIGYPLIILTTYETVQREYYVMKDMESKVKRTVVTNTTNGSSPLLGPHNLGGNGDLYSSPSKRSSQEEKPISNSDLSPTSRSSSVKRGASSQCGSNARKKSSPSMTNGFDTNISSMGILATPMNIFIRPKQPDVSQNGDNYGTTTTQSSEVYTSSSLEDENNMSIIEQQEDNEEEDEELSIFMNNCNGVSDQQGHFISPLFALEVKRKYLDEAHRVRNPRIKTSEALQEIKSQSCFGLTGTPIFNKEEDIITLSELCTPKNRIKRNSPPHCLKTWKKQFLLRRGKNVVHTLPSLNEEDVWLVMYPEERERYDALLSAAKAAAAIIIPLPDEEETPTPTETVTSQSNRRIDSNSNSSGDNPNVSPENGGAKRTKDDRALRALVRLRQECNSTVLKYGYDLTSKMVECARKRYLTSEEVDSVSVKRTTKELVFTEEEQYRLLNITPTEDEDGVIDFIPSEEDFHRRKQLINKLKKQRHREKKIMERKRIHQSQQKLLSNISQSTHQSPKTDRDSLSPNADMDISNSPASLSDDTNVQICEGGDRSVMDEKEDYIETVVSEIDVEAISNGKDTSENQIPSEDHEQKTIEPEPTTVKEDVFDKLIKDQKLQNPVDMEELDFPRSVKMDYIIDFVVQRREEDLLSKTVIVSQFTTFLDLVEIQLLKRQFKIVRLDGRQQRPDVRKHVLDRFCNNADVTIFLTSLKAGGEGLNLVSAWYLIIVDPWWNRPVECQARDRIHRIGQTRPVMVKRLLIKNSIEESVLHIQEQKEKSERQFLQSEVSSSFLSLNTIISHYRSRNNS